MKLTILSLCLLSLMAVAGSAEVVNIDTEELERLLDQGVPVVDVRTAPEWRETGVVSGSRLATFFDEQGRYDLESWMAELATVAGPNDPLILICRSGNRSLTIAKYLDSQAGYRRVYNVTDGIRGWIRDGRATTAPPPPSS